MELRHLRYFVAVAEEQNVSRAAKRLHVSQPPLSVQIRDLETELGIALFERSSQAIRLTEAGGTLLLEARAALQRVEDAIVLTKSVANQKRSQVRVGYSVPPAIEILPRALQAFQGGNPEVSVDLRMMTALKMLRALRSGDLDVALTVYIQPTDFEGLMVEQLGTYPLGVACHKEHRFARLREVSMSEVARQPILAFSREEYPSYHRLIANLLLPYTRTPKIVSEYDNLESVIMAVEAGNGVAILYENVSGIFGQRLVLRALDPAPEPPPVVIAYRKEGVSAKVGAFVEAARTAKLKPFLHTPLLTTGHTGTRNPPADQIPAEQDSPATLETSDAKLAGTRSILTEPASYRTRPLVEPALGSPPSADVQVKGWKA